ncbi:MAG: ABC transporter ATP-binding protein [Acidobacteria bacterium]|nr:ABC transporter ATP-binding protein [Acidobacteriota bacterium]
MEHGGHMRMVHSMSQSLDADVVLERTTTRRVLLFARPYWTMIAWFIVMVTVGSLLQLVPPLLLQTIIDGAIADEDSAWLNTLGLIIVGAAFAAAGVAMIERWLSARIGESVIYDLRVRLFDHVQRMPISFFTRTQTGSLISRMNNDVIGAQRALTGTLGSVVSSVISLVTTLLALMLLEWRLTILGLLILPVFLVPAKRVGSRLAEITRESMDLNASMNTTMTERFNVSGALLVKLFGRSDDEINDFGDRAGRVRDIGIRSALYSRTFVVALSLVGALGTAAVYIVGGHMVINETMTVGTLTAMSLLIVRVYTPLTSLTNARVDVMSAFVSFDRVFEVLDAENPIEDPEDPIELADISGRVEFDHVSFQYPGPDQVSVASLESPEESQGSTSELAPALIDIDLEIEPGQLIALVGPSGAGKTTMINLLPRLYDVTEGAVRIDGVDVRAASLDSLRRCIGVVNQDPHLFHETVASNLRYARPGASDEELVTATKAARIHTVIEALPNGFDTVVGERGYRLSGGEKQRLSIARMLLKDPAIVVLDEATSHLDSENEAQVQNALATALKGRTAIVVAHRLSTITTADKIVVLDEARIVETGTHDELYAAGGLYADLYNTLLRQEPDNTTV